MKRTLLTCIVTAALVSVVGLFNLYAADAPDDLVLKVPLGAKATKHPVSFSHKGHAFIDCRTCHHMWDGNGEIKKCAAEGCHIDASQKGKKKPTSFYSAFHAKAENSCVGCHKMLGKAKKATGPTKCSDCHRR